ncbi:hypothetical protein HYG81_22455 (plasmid) [Natrinema zhouii]|uniref:hypothetical protein n=1 Tax=Natrinema zhouii TaxID=1710539 RepID=UPI001CFFAB05|nr:hypothetical protein [Natrinema zhouii]UHQ98724.1 hypothetical protein HYG81_22455 [Natrinema zhouii]
MSRFRELKQIVQRSEYYETDTGRKLRLRAEAEVIARTEWLVPDGGTVTAEATQSESEKPTYTRHVEPPEQGGKAYVRCTYCERELLVELGGQDNLSHAPGCPERESR